MAINVVKYAKNVARSFGYAAVDVIGDLNPTIKSFSESNEELGKELYAAVTDWKGTVKKAKHAAIESDIYEFATAYKKNLFEDLKNGTFYNKTREDEYAERIGGVSDEQLKSEFDDMFGDDFDLGGWDEGDLASDMFLAGTMDDVGSKVANANAEVTARSAEYIVKGQKESTRVLYEQNNRLFGEALKGMAAINANIGQFSGAIAEIAQTHANNSKTFFENADSKLDRIVEMLDSINKNTSPSSDLKNQNEKAKKELTFRDIVDSEGMPNFKKYISHIKKNIKDNSGDLGMLGDMFGSGENVLMSFAASPLQDLTKMMVRQVIPNVVEKSMAEFNDTLQGFFGSAISLLNKQKGSDNPLLNWASKIFGIDTEFRTSIDTSRYEKGRVPWDGASRKALVEIIPAQLSKIVSALTGEVPSVFNTETGRMESIRDIKESADWRMQNSANYAGGELRKLINQVMADSKISFRNKSQNDKFYSDLDKFFLNAFAKGGINSNDITSTGLFNLGVENNSTLVADIIERLGKSPEGRKALLGMNRRILSERDSLNRTYRSMEENGSIEALLESGMFEEFFKKDKEDKEYRKRTGYTGVRGSGISGIFDQIDNYGHSMFYYAQEIFKRQDAIYKFTGFMVDNWGAGGGGGKRKGKYRSNTKVATDLTDISPDKDALSKSLDYIDKENEKKDEEWYNDSVKRFREKNKDYVDGYFSEEEKGKFNINVDAAEYRRKQDEERQPKNWIDRMLSEKTLSGKLGAAQGGIQTFLTKPLEAFGNMLGAADEKMYKLIYGEADKDLEDLGLLGVLRQNIEGFFQKTNDFIDNKILNPLKAKLGMDANDPLLRKIIGEERYDRWKEKMKDGIIGTKDEATGIRSGGLLGDYIQSVKDNAKDAWDWAKESAKSIKDEIGDAFGGVLSPWRSKRSMDTYATGGQVKKTGIAAVSEGELIIPSELNPFYHGKTDKKKQIRDENRAVQKFFGNFALGETAVGRSGFTNGSEEEENEISAAIDGKIVELAKARGVDEGTLRYHLRIAQSKLTDKNIVNRVKILKREARKVIMSHKKVHDANDGTGNEAKIIDFDAIKRQYVTDDGIVKNLKDGEFINTLKDGTLEKRAKGKRFAGSIVDEGKSMAKSIKNVYHRYDGRKGDNDPQSKAFDDTIDDIKGNASSYGGAATVGAGIGAGLGMLVGMPLLGAAVGGAVGLIKKSDGVQKFLFGEESTDENGNAVQKGGIFSKKTQEFIEKKLPGMAKWGLAGMAAGLVLPGGPIMGTMLGAAFSYAKDSQTISDLLFNQEDEHGALIHRGSLKMTRDEFNKRLQKKLPKMGLGAVAGLLIGGPFGMVGNIMLGSALGFASDTEWGKNILFGHKGTEVDENGDPIRHGGLIEHVTDQVKMLFGFGKEETKGLAQFFKEDVMDPITGSIQPVVKSFEVFGTNLDFYGKKIVKGFKKIFGESMGDAGAFMDNKLFRGVKHLTGDLAHGAIGLAKLPLTLPGQILGGIGNRLERRQLSKGQVDYRTAQERIDRREALKFKNSMAARYGKVGNKFKNSFKDFGRGRLISGTGELIGALGSGIYQTAAGGISDAIGSIGAGARNEFNTYEAMDEWMANASDEELQNMYEVAITAQNASKGVDEARKRVLDTLKGDTASLKFLNPEDRKKLFKAASKGDYGKLNAALYDVKTTDNKPLTEIQMNRIRDLLGGAANELSNIDARRNDLEGQSSAAWDKLRSNDKFGSLFNQYGEGFNERALENFISQMEYEKIAKTGERNADKEIKDQMEQDKEQHEEVKDLFKVAINVLSAMAANSGVAVDLPYPGAGNISGVNIDFNRAFSFTNNMLSGSDTEEDSEEDEETTETGKYSRKKDRKGKRKKRREREQQTQDDGRADVEDVDTDNFYGSHALGGIIGEAIQKNIISPDGNFMYDAESHEYKAADSETIEKVKRKTDMQEAIIQIPTKIDSLISTMGGNPVTGESNEDDENGDKTLLGSILDSLGMDGKIKDMILGFKNLSWIPTVAGPVLLAGLFTGIFDKPLSDLIKTIMKALGVDETTIMNSGSSGEDGEEGFSDRAKKAVARQVLTGANPKYVSSILDWAGGKFIKASDKLAEKNGIFSKLKSKLFKTAGNATNKASKFTEGLEDNLVKLRNGENIFKKSSDELVDGYSIVEGNGKKFIYDDTIGDFVTDDIGNALSTTDDAASKYLKNSKSKGEGLFSKAFNKVKGVFGKKISKEAAEDVVQEGTEKVSKFAKYASKASELYGYVKNPASIFTSGVKDTVSNYSRSVQNKIKNKLTGKADDVVEDAAENSGRIKEEASKIAGKLKDFFNTLIKKGKMPEAAADAAQKAADKIGDKIIETAAKQGGKKAVKKNFLQQIKSGMAQMGPIGWAAAVTFAISDYSNGYSECEKIIGVEDPTIGERVITGLMSCIRGLLETILGIIQPLEIVTLAVSILVSNKDIANIFINTIGKKLTPDIIDRRNQYASKITSYNERNNTSYDVEQYEYTVKNNKGLFAKDLAGLKSLFKGQKWFQKEMSGTDSKGNLVSEWIDESTNRWKYYQRAIDQGKISREYAEALYMNECLHDPEYILTEERIADYKKRIESYKSTTGAMEIPEITTKLPGLIEKGSVTQQGTGSSWMMQFTTQNPNYGNGKSSDSYTGLTSMTEPLVGTFANGGVVDRSGYAALSKGEYVVNGKNSLANLIGGLFGSSKSIDYKDYDDLTDVSGVVEDMMSMDSATTDWKKYWSKVDEGVSNSPLSPLKKLLRRIAASLAMPSFALGKVVENVQGMYDSALGTRTTSSSSSSASYSASTSTSATSSTRSSSGGFIGKAVSKVKGFLGKLFGKGSGLYGGASSLDGSFISQMGALGNYGDSSYSEEGCAPATAAMFINSINKGGMTLEQAGDYAVKKGYKVKGDGTKEGFFQDIFANNGIPTENISGKGVLDALKAGKPTVLLGQDEKNASKADSPFGRNPHYVLATGLDKSGNVIINDPESSNGGTVYSQRILSKVKSAISTKMQGGRSGLTGTIHYRKFYGGSTDDERRKTIWDFLVHDQQMTEYAAAGIMGCWQIESSNNPKRVECDYLSSCKADAATATDSLDNLHNYTVNHVFPAYTKIKIHKEGYAGGDGRYYCGLGLAQWTGPRTKRLIEFSNQHGLAWNDLSGQLSFFMSEFNGAYSSVKKAINAATSIPEATKIFLKGFEGSSKGLTERTNEAQKIYNKFHGTQKDTDVNTFVTTVDGSSDSMSTTGTTSATTDPSNPFGGLFDNLLSKMYGSTAFNTVFGSSASTGADATGTTGAAATGGVDSTGGTSGGITSSDGSIGQNVAVDAASYLGNPYVWGGNDLNNGIDCSGFVQQMYKKHGFDALAKARGNTKGMWADNYGNKVGNDISSLKPGDVMFFSNNGQASGIHHVGIYVGNNHMIHAQSKNTGIVDTDLANSSTYRNEFIGAERYGSGSGINQNRIANVAKLFGGASGTSSNESKVLENRRMAQTEKEATGVMRSITRLTQSKGKDGIGLDNLVTSLDSIKTLLEKLVSNTDAIATIANLITELVGLKKGSGTKSSSKSSSNSYGLSESEDELQNMVSILTQLAQA